MCVLCPQVSRKQGDLMLVDCLDALCTNYSRTKIAQGKCGFGRDTALAFHPTASRLYISFMVRDSLFHPDVGFCGTVST